ncbi:MAG: DUF2283 domain-containing protein [Syntrophales bacterium]
MKKQKLISINYDSNSDVLYISFGKATDAISIEIEEGTLIRIDPFKQIIVGITIVDFSAKYMGKGKKSVELVANKIVPRILDEYKSYLIQNQLN